MELFVRFMFGMMLISVFLKILNLVKGTYNDPVKISTYCADAVLACFLCIWAGFVLWY